MEQENPRTIRLREQYLGKEFDFNKGNSDIKMKIVEFKDSSNVTVQVGDSNIYITTHINNIRRGKVRNPFKENSPIAFTNPKYEYLGCVFRTNQGYLIKILNCDDRDHVLYEFIDTGYQDTAQLRNIVRGNVKNPFHRNKAGGYLGTDKTYRHTEFDWLHTIWTTVLNRKMKNTNEILLDERWYCYSMFAAWYMYHYVSLVPDFRYSVNNTLKYPQYAMFSNGKKCYGPDTCVLVPKYLNTMLTTAEIENAINTKDVVLPEDHIVKTNAKYYRDSYALSDEVYELIMRI